MTSHYVIESTAGTQVLVDACFPTLAEAITYCVGKTEAIYESWQEPDLYKISEFQGSELLAEWDGRGNKTWDARYKV